MPLKPDSTPPSAAHTSRRPTIDLRADHGEAGEDDGTRLGRVLSSTDHKIIGAPYLGTAFTWFLIGGILALLVRGELAYPGMQLVNDQIYNQLFSMHGTIMLLLFATPLFLGTWDDDVPDADLRLEHARHEPPGARRIPDPGGALLMLEADRILGAHVFDPAHGGAVLWQHLFWFFGHPEV